MTARKKWRTITDGATQSHPSESAVYRWLEKQPIGTDVRVEATEGNRWVWYEQVKVTENGLEPR